jgi:coproporphyrinogen III oxidase-like Fe-S oxidoreductase
VERIRSAVPYIATVNVDLIFNQPHQTVASLQRDLRIFRTLGANQISLYPLMASRSARPHLARTMGLPDRRRLRKFYEVILGELAPDYLPTSAWCFTRAGRGSDEYLVTNEHYVGVGSGAFSYLDGTLYSTSFSLRSYAQNIAAGHTGITACHSLSETERMRYTLLVKMFGLGLSRKWAEARHGTVFCRQLWPEILSLELLGAARRTTDGWRLSPRGMFWLMLMMSEFFESVNAYRDAMRAQVHEELEHFAHPNRHADCAVSAPAPVSALSLSR